MSMFVFALWTLSKNIVNRRRESPITGHKVISGTVQSFIYWVTGAMSDCLHRAFPYVAPLLTNSWGFFNSVCFSLAGRSFASQWSAGCRERGVAPGQVQPRGHGNAQALHVHGGKHPWQDPAGRAPQAGGAHRGETVNAFIRSVSFQSPWFCT